MWSVADTLQTQPMQGGFTISSGQVEEVSLAQLNAAQRVLETHRIYWQEDNGFKMTSMSRKLLTSYTAIVQGRIAQARYEKQPNETNKSYCVNNCMLSLATLVDLAGDAGLEYWYVAGFVPFSATGTIVQHVSQVASRFMHRRELISLITDHPVLYYRRIANDDPPGRADLSG